MKKKNIFITLALSLLLPLLAVVSLYYLAMSTNLPGRRGGQQDAFRHTYSTALTARYLSPKIVEFVTWASERNPNNKFDRMDIHNNRIGTQIGLEKGELYKVVMEKILAGKENSEDENTVTWLPEKEWDNGL